MDQNDRDKWFDPDLTTFGDRIAGAREQAGMSQADLAERLGVRLHKLIEWEDDFSEPRANRLSTMAGLLNVSLPWLLTGEGDGPVAPSERDLPDVPEHMVDILSEMRQLRAQMIASADRLNGLERQLRQALKEDAAR